jgi:anaerobic ribonucleoside-triphosphate reductase activating protein
LRLHQRLPRSQANGPGARAVLWLQGCTLACPGCFNPETHPRAGGELVGVPALVAWLGSLGDAIEGVTISGGEPLQQRRPLLALLQRLRQETALSVLLFSGYAWGEIQRMPEASALLANLDVLIAGRYRADRRLARDLRGSANKSVHLLSDRYTLDDLRQVPPAEVIITPDGQVVMSGIDPLRWA